MVQATQPSTGLVDQLLWCKTSATGNSTYRYATATSSFVQIYEIMGSVNTGSLTASKVNFVDVKLQAAIPK